MKMKTIYLAVDPGIERTSNAPAKNDPMSKRKVAERGIARKREVKENHEADNLQRQTTVTNLARIEAITMMKAEANRAS